jgi:pseudoazurin
VAVGDVVRFVPEVPGHDCRSIAGMVPEGAPGWKGKLSQEVTAAITLPGVYGYKCVPHYGMGMVGLLVAGNPSINLAAARAFRHPGKAAKAFESLLAELG